MDVDETICYRYYIMVVFVYELRNPNDDHVVQRPSFIRDKAPPRSLGRPLDCGERTILELCICRRHRSQEKRYSQDGKED